MKMFMGNPEMMRCWRNMIWGRSKVTLTWMLYAALLAEIRRIPRGWVV